MRNLFNPKVLVKTGKHEFMMDKLLYENLLHLKKKNKDDWDFKILISGSGLTRVGKSTLAAQIGVLFDPNMILDSLVFSGDILIKRSMKLGKNKVIIYDEAREGLDSRIAMSSYSNNIITHFNKCGMLNQYLILVLPDYFDLNRSIALNLSICLINCYVIGDFQRGFFRFYSRKRKKYLYIKGKKFHNYNASAPSFHGSFTDYFPFNLTEYNRYKRKFIDDTDRKSKSYLRLREEKFKNSRNNAIVRLYRDGMDRCKIAELFKMTPENVTMIMKKYGARI